MTCFVYSFIISSLNLLNIALFGWAFVCSSVTLCSSACYTPIQQKKRKKTTVMLPQLQLLHGHCTKLAGQSNDEKTTEQYRSELLWQTVNTLTRSVDCKQSYNILLCKYTKIYDVELDITMKYSCGALFSPWLHWTLSKGAAENPRSSAVDASVVELPVLQAACLHVCSYTESEHRRRSK